MRFTPNNRRLMMGLQTAISRAARGGSKLVAGDWIWKAMVWTGADSATLLLVPMYLVGNSFYAAGPRSDASRHHFRQ